VTLHHIPKPVTLSELALDIAGQPGPQGSANSGGRRHDG